MDFPLSLFLSALARRPRDEITSPAFTDLAPAATDGDWDVFGRLVRHHQVEALLLHRLKETGHLDQLPDPIREASTTRTREQIAWTLVQVRELNRLLERLREAGLRALPWKGPGLSQWLHGQPWLRDFADLDLLLASEADALRAREVLLAEGYEDSLSEVAEDGEADWFPDSHCLALEKADAHALVELHQKALPPEFLPSPDFESLWESRTSWHFQEHLVPDLSPTHQGLLACLHAAKHDWTQLRWVLDCEGVLRRLKEDELEALLAEAHELGARSALLAGFLFAESLFGGALPASVIRELGSAPRAKKASQLAAERLVANPFATLVTQHSRAAIHRHWLIQDRWRNRAHLLGDLAVYSIRPNRNDRELARRFHLPQPCAGLLRPFRLLRTYGIRRRSR